MRRNGTSNETGRFGWFCAPGSGSCVLRPYNCGRGALGTPLVERNRWKLVRSPIMTSGGGSDANIVAERRARSARVRWRVGGVIRGHRRSSCAVWRESGRWSPGFSSCIADCRADDPTALKVVRSLTRRFRGSFSGTYGPLGGSERNNGEMWRAYAVPMPYVVQPQPPCTALYRIDVLRRVQTQI